MGGGVVEEGWLPLLNLGREGGGVDTTLKKWKIEWELNKDKV